MSLYNRGRAAPRLMVVVVLAMVALWGCPDTSPGEEKPDAPDMSALLAEYENPTAPLTAETMPLLVESVFETLELMSGTGGFGFILSDVLGAAAGGEEGDGDEGMLLSELQVREQGLSVDGDGFVRVTRICNGWEGATVPNSADGAIFMTLGFTGDEESLRVDPVAWGSFAGCKYGVSDGEGSRRNLLVDGALRVWLGDNLSVDGLGKSSILMDVEGTIRLDEDLEFSSVNFSVNPETGGLGFKLPVGDGHVVAGFMGEQNSFRAANGVWTCDFEAATCTCTEGCSGSDSFSWQ